MADDDMLDEPVDELSVTLGDLLPESVKPTGRKRLAQDLYDMEYRLDGDPGGYFPEAFEYAYAHPKAWSTAAGKHSVSVQGDRLRLEDVSFSEVEGAILAAVKSAIASANELVKDAKARQQEAEKQQARHDKAEIEQRKAFIERMNERKQ
jgi:hypothetical protein